MATKRPAAAATSNGKLRTGDIIFLTLEQDSAERGIFDQKRAFVTAEGLADTRVGLEVHEDDVPSDFHQCIFRVLPKLSYAFTEARIERDASDSRDKEMMNERRAEEVAKNNAIIEQHVGDEAGKIGQIVSYGQQIQLQHVHSGLFLSNAPGKLGHMEKHNRRLELAKDPSEGAWFKFRPRFKIRSLGSPVYMNDQVTVQNVKSEPPHYLHAGNRQFEGEERFEANLTLVKDDEREPQTAWRVQNYREVAMKESGKYFNPNLYLGNVLQLYHPEAEAFVTGTCNTNIDKLPYLMRIRDSDLRNWKNIRAKSMFRIEALNKSEGAAVTYSSDEVRLRHVTSGKYLTVDHSHSHLLPEMVERFDELQPMPADGVWTSNNMYSMEAGVLLGATLEAESIPHRQLFKVHAVTMLGNQEDNTIRHSDLNVRLEHTLRNEQGNPTPLVRRVSTKSGVETEHLHSVWFHNSTVPKESEEDSSAVTGIGGSGRVGLRLAFCERMLDQDAITLIPVDEKVVHDVYRIMGAKVVIQVRTPPLAPPLAPPLPFLSHLLSHRATARG
jgi:hypothetical protein